MNYTFGVKPDARHDGETQPAAAGSSGSPRVEVVPGGVVDRLLQWGRRHRRGVFLIALAIYALAFNGQWKMTPDAANYLWTGRALLLTGEFAWFWPGQPPYHPGLPMLIAGCFGVLGINAIWSVMIVLFAAALASLGLVYVLVSRVLGPGVAAIVLLMMACSERLLRTTVFILTDVPFLAGLLVFLLGSLAWTRHARSRGWRERWSGALLVAVGIAVMAAFRSVVITVLVGAVAAMAWGVLMKLPVRPATRWAVAGAAGAAAVAAVVFAGVSPQVERLSPDIAYAVSRLLDVEGFWDRLFPEAVVKFFNIAMPYAVFGVELQWIGPVLVVGLLAATLLMWRWSVLWVAVVWAFVLQILAFVIVERYFLPILPLLAVAWLLGAAWIERRVAGRLGRWLAVAMLVFWFVPNVIGVGGLIVEQRKVPFHAHFKDGRYQPIMASADALGELPKGELIVSGIPDAGTLGYFTRGGSMPAYIDNAFWSAMFKRNVRERDRVLLAYPDHLDLEAYVLMAEIEVEPTPLLRLGTFTDERGEHEITIHRGWLPRYTVQDFDELYRGVLRIEPNTQTAEQLASALVNGERFLPETAVSLMLGDLYRDGAGFVLALRDLAGLDLPSREELDADVQQLMRSSPRRGHDPHARLVERWLDSDTRDRLWRELLAEMKGNPPANPRLLDAIERVQRGDATRDAALAIYLRESYLRFPRASAFRTALASVALWSQPSPEEAEEALRFALQRDLHTTKDLAQAIGNMLRERPYTPPEPLPSE